MANRRSFFSKGLEGAAKGGSRRIDDLLADRRAQEDQARLFAQQTSLAEGRDSAASQRATALAERQEAAAALKAYQDLISDVAGQSDLGSVPGPGGIDLLSGAFGLTPDQTQQLGQTADRRKVFLSDLNDQMTGLNTDTIAPDGTPGRKLLSGEFLPTGLNAEAQGAFDATVFNAGTPGATERAGSIATTQAEVDQRFNPTLRAGLDGDGNPAWLEFRNGQFEAVPGGEPVLPGGAGGAGGNGDQGDMRGRMVQTMFNDFKLLSDNSINTKQGLAALANGAKRHFFAFFNLDPDAANFQGRGLSLATAAVALISGAQASVRELEGLRAILPTLFTDERVAKAFLRTFEDMITAAVNANAHLNLNTQADINQAIKDGALKGSGEDGEFIVYTDMINALNDAKDNAFALANSTGGPGDTNAPPELQNNQVIDMTPQQVLDLIQERLGGQ